MIPAIVAKLPVEGSSTEVVLVAGKMGKAFAYRADDGKRLWTLSVGKHENDTGPLPRRPTTIFPGDFGGVETPMAFADGRLFVPWVDFPARATATGLVGGFATNFNAARGGLAAVDAARGKLLWQHRFPAIDVGAATVANDVVFTSTYDGTIYAFDTKTGKQLLKQKAPAGINSFPAVVGDSLLIGAAAPGFLKSPHFQLVSYSIGTRAPAMQRAAAASTTVNVQGGEFFFKLSKKSTAKPGKVTFVFKNVGHLLHDFHISGKQTPLIQPGKTAKLVVTFKKKGKYPYLCTVPGHAAAGMKGTLTVR